MTYTLPILQKEDVMAERTPRPRGRPRAKPKPKRPRRKGEGGVYRVEDPQRKRWREGFRWRAELDLGIVDGKRKVLTHYAPTEEAAEEWLAQQL